MGDAHKAEQFASSSLERLLKARSSFGASLAETSGRFLGPLPCDGDATLDLGLAALVGAFARAQERHCLRLASWVHHRAERKHRWRSGGVGAFLLDGPSAAQDLELCVLAINGGALQLIAGISQCVERVLMLDGREPMITPSDFQVPRKSVGFLCDQLPVAPPAERAENTRRILAQRVEADLRGRTVCEVIRDAVCTLARLHTAAEAYSDEAQEGAQKRDLGTAAFRVHFCVRWARGEAAGEGARIWIDEVEHSGKAGNLVGWFGCACTMMALRAWVVGGDPEQLEMAMGNISSPGGSILTRRKVESWGDFFCSTSLLSDPSS